MKEEVCLHGIPKSILSDQDPLFISKFWQKLFRMQGTTLHMSSSYHPESGGQTEVVNRCLETYLRCFAIEQPGLWSFWIPWTEFWYNTSFHTSIGTTPFEIVYGRKPPTVMQHIPSEVMTEVVARYLQDKDEALQQLKLHLTRAQEQMKHNANMHRQVVQAALSLYITSWLHITMVLFRLRKSLDQLPTYRNSHQVPRYIRYFILLF